MSTARNVTISTAKRLNARLAVLSPLLRQLGLPIVPDVQPVLAPDNGGDAINKATTASLLRQMADVDKQILAARKAIDNGERAPAPAAAPTLGTFYSDGPPANVSPPLDDAPADSGLAVPLGIGLLIYFLTR